MERSGAVGVALAGTVGLVVLALPVEAQGGRTAVYLELTCPQSDDRGRCIEPQAEGFTNRVTGRVSARGEVEGVVVNGVQAWLGRTAIHALGAPPAWPKCSFEVLFAGPVAGEISVSVRTQTGAGIEARFVPDTEGTLSRLRQLAGGAPGDAEARYRVGSALFELDRTAEAKAEFVAATGLAPDNALFHTGLGQLLWGEKETDRAIEEFRTAARLDPESSGAQQMLGIGLAVKGETDAGLAALRTACNLEPKSPYPHWLMGLLFQALGERQKAIAEQRKAIELCPNLAEARAALANLLVDEDKPGEAAEHSRKALEIDPQLVDARVVLARALQLQEDTEQAVAECRKALETDPEHAEAHAVMGGLLLVQEKPDESVVEFRKAIVLDGASSRAYAGLAIALYQEGDYTAAEQMLLKARVLGFELEEEVQDEIRGKAKIMKSWFMNPGLSMGLVFLPLLGLLAAMAVGSAMAGGAELYPRTLAWRQVFPASMVLAISILAIFAIQIAFQVVHVSPQYYGTVTKIMAFAALFAVGGLAMLVVSIAGCRGHGKGAPVGPGGVPRYCGECGKTINLWRMYTDGRETRCANCWRPSALQPPAGPPPPPDPQPPPALPPPEPPPGLP